jgi:hypothetical protein
MSMRSPQIQFVDFTSTIDMEKRTFTRNVESGALGAMVIFRLFEIGLGWVSSN